jgi:hypothetical protein
MNIPFGVHYQPFSLAWENIRKGPSLAAVREHLDRVDSFGRRAAARQMERQR